MLSIYKFRNFEIICTTICLFSSLLAVASFTLISYIYICKRISKYMSVLVCKFVFCKYVFIKRESFAAWIFFTPTVPSNSSPFISRSKYRTCTHPLTYTPTYDRSVCVSAAFNLDVVFLLFFRTLINEAEIRKSKSEIRRICGLSSCNFLMQNRSINQSMREEEVDQVTPQQKNKVFKIESHAIQ